MVQDTPSRKLDQYIVRFPDGMRDRLKAMAAENNRSLNAEIISILSAAIKEDDAWNESLDRADDDDLEHITAEIALAKSVGQQTGSPANVVMMARLLEKTTAMQADIQQKLDALIELQNKKS